MGGEGGEGGGKREGERDKGEGKEKREGDRKKRVKEVENGME